MPVAGVAYRRWYTDHGCASVGSASQFAGFSAAVGRCIHYSASNRFGRWPPVAVSTDETAAAIDRDGAAGDEAGVGSGQEHRGSANVVFGVTGAPDRQRRQRRFKVLGPFLEVLQGCVAKSEGADGVDSDALGSPLARRGAGNAANGRLGRNLAAITVEPLNF